MCLTTGQHLLTSSALLFFGFYIIQSAILVLKSLFMKLYQVKLPKRTAIYFLLQKCVCNYSINRK